MSSSTQQCGDLVCPEDAICDLEHHVCTTREELLQCLGKADREPCTLAGQEANCQGESCLAMVCGNMLLDRNEACDDGNARNADGCSADCASAEVCGNGIADFQVGEQCDDGNTLQHDGCSTGCTVEIAQWDSGQPPPWSTGAATYDARLGELLVFTGTTVNSAGDKAVLDQMWRWKGGWSRVPYQGGPSLREQSALVYHAALGRTILIGGGLGQIQELRDVWSWDGQQWTRMADLPVPMNGLRGHSAVYDARRKRIVVFGGINSQMESDATYELDANGTWSVATPTTKPFGRYYAQMAYDPERGKTVLVGGNGSTGGPAGYNDTWEYDGDWHLIATSGSTLPNTMNGVMAFDGTSHRMILAGGQTESNAASLAVFGYTAGANNTGTWASLPGLPTARTNMMFADGGAGRLVLYGGTDSSGALETTMLWDGNVWSPPLPEPQAFLSPSMFGSGVANDLDRRRVVVFGGRPTNASFHDGTWELSAAGWKKIGVSTATAFMAMTYDTARHEVIRFGGQTSAGLSAVTATWNGQVWTTKTPATSPTARVRSSMAFDVARGEAIMFGGTLTSGALLDETWAWNGSTWTNKTPSIKPPARYGAAMAYDWAHQRIVLFGGMATMLGMANDTWLWDGTNWQMIDVPVRPRERELASLVWNPARQRLVLFGGAYSESTVPLDFDTWEWDGDAQQWTQLLTINEPLATDSAAGYMLLDGSGVGLVLGKAPSTGPAAARVRSDSWQLSFASSRPSEVCERTLDNDGDGQMGCDDPDCWMSCAPECPPAPATSVCDPALPHCGDGICSAGESCGSCADCTCTPVCGDFVCDAGETGCLGDCP